MQRAGWGRDSNYFFFLTGVYHGAILRDPGTARLTVIPRGNIPRADVQTLPDNQTDALKYFKIIIIIMPPDTVRTRVCDKNKSTNLKRLHHYNDGLEGPN